MLWQTVALLGFAALFVYNFYWKRRNWPPGPPPLPFVGNLLSLAIRPTGEQCFNEWAKTYGPVYTFWLSEMPVIIVMDYDLIVEMFVKDGDSYADRPQFDGFFNRLIGGMYGIFLLNQGPWREQRQFAVSVFRELGVGTKLMQEKIIHDMSERFAGLDKRLARQSDVFEPHKVFGVASGSIIHEILFGRRFDEENEHEYWHMKNLINDVLSISQSPTLFLVAQFPFLAPLPYVGRAARDLNDTVQRIHAYYGAQIDRHVAALTDADLETPSRDYVEAFLKAQRKRELAGDSNHHFTRNQLISACRDLWTGGEESIGLTMSWMIAYILHRPDVQTRLHDELSDVIGDVDRWVTMGDRPWLPYVSATVHESQRIANTLPFNIMKMTTRDVTVNGHFLPKGTFINQQISALMYDPEIFPEPMKFKPERHLSADGSRLVVREELLPFSIGKRMCPGESLARMELFLFIANFFNRYTISPTDGWSGRLPSLERRQAGLIGCRSYECRLQRRQC